MKKQKSITQNIRLSKDVTPLKYHLTLHPDLTSHLFSGEEVITLVLTKATNTITLHSKELAIESATMSGMSATISYDTATETATFTFPKKIIPGTYKLTLVFSGVLSDNMRGFYKSSYVVNGETRTMATTQFEATDARRAFPCFDEPTHKAVFHIKLVVPLGKTAISNTLPTEIKEHSAGYQIVSFDPTPKMSTYLLAFIVGDFEWIEDKTNSGVLVRIMAVPGKIHQAKFALDVTVRCLEFYEKYFAIKYPLNTLDMIAIPDFSSLAMENWGAITFREIGLLVDEEHTSTATREMVAIVIAHELAHQWFGNLVTMEWWTHLWLNEGFASYIPYLAIDHMFPEWQIWDQFATDDLATALKLDGLLHTHPIEVDVHNPNEIGEIFDAVSYSKGATVIRMLAEYIGDKAFRDGLRHYLKKHKYSNASTVHLWEAFEHVSGKPVKNMMHVWTTKSGYPIISVEEKGTKVTVSQSRYFASAQSRTKTTDATRWPIPLSRVTDRGVEQIDLFTKQKATFTLSERMFSKWNAHEVGLYRTLYDASSLAKLAVPLAEGRLSSSDRLGVIRDLFSLAEAGYISTTVPLEYVGYYRTETEYIVWIEIISGLRYLANLLHGTPSEKAFRAYACEVLSPIIERMTFDPKTGERHTDALLRSLVLGAGSYFGHVGVIHEAKQCFANMESQIVSPDLRGVIYATVARTGGVAEYEALLARYRAETLHEEKNRILSALGQFPNKTLIKRTLMFIMSAEVRMQDRNGAFASVLLNMSGRAIAWEFIKKNWKTIGEAYGEGNHLLSRLVSVLNRFTTREEYTDVKSFFKTHRAPGAERTILQTLEHIESNIAWLKRDGKKIEKWFKDQ